MSTPVTRTSSRVAEPDRAAALAAPAQRHLGAVELVALAGQRPRRQHPLVDVAELAAEGDEGAGPDHPGDLALEDRVEAALAELALEQVGGADVVGAALDLGRLALAGRGVGGGVAAVAQRRRLLPLPQRRQQRPVDDAGRGSAGSAR